MCDVLFMEESNCRNDKLKLGACILINKSGLIFLLKVLVVHCLNGCTGALRIM